MKHYCIAEMQSDLKNFKRQELRMDEVNSIQFTESVEKNELIVTMNFPDRKGTKMFGMRIARKELQEMMKYLDNL